MAVYLSLYLRDKSTEMYEFNKPSYFRYPCLGRKMALLLHVCWGNMVEKNE